jgi:hypothetical protein
MTMWQTVWFTDKLRAAHAEGKLPKNACRTWSVPGFDGVLSSSQGAAWANWLAE